MPVRLLTDTEPQTILMRDMPDGALGVIEGGNYAGNVVQMVWSEARVRGVGSTRYWCSDKFGDLRVRLLQPGEKLEVT